MLSAQLVVTETHPLTNGLLMLLNETIPAHKPGTKVRVQGEEVVVTDLSDENVPKRPGMLVTWCENEEHPPTQCVVEITEPYVHEFYKDARFDVRFATSALVEDRLMVYDRTYRVQDCVGMALQAITNFMISKTVPPRVA